MRAAVIGAGLSGLACAQVLAEAGCAVSIYDKSRGVGGRMATRRVTTPIGEASFDHGAQYFTARDPAFAALVETWGREGVASAWEAAGPGTFVGVPTMTAPLKHLARGVDITFGYELRALERRQDLWRLGAADGREAHAEILVLAVPAEQARTLLAQAGHPFAARAAASETSPCWTVMAAFGTPLSPVADCLRLQGPLSWAARNSAKPGRGGPEAWILQAGPDWSAAHLEDDGPAVARDLLKLFSETAGFLPEPVALLAHRWRYARSAPSGPGRLWDPEKRLAVCGDWLLEPRIEAAYLSGRTAAHAVLSGI